MTLESLPVLISKSLEMFYKYAEPIALIFPILKPQLAIHLNNTITAQQSALSHTKSLPSEHGSV